VSCCVDSARAHGASRRRAARLRLKRDPSGGWHKRSRRLLREPFWHLELSRGHPAARITLHGARNATPSQQPLGRMDDDVVADPWFDAQPPEVEERDLWEVEQERQEREARLAYVAFDRRPRALASRIVPRVRPARRPLARAPRSRRRTTRSRSRSPGREPDEPDLDAAEGRRSSSAWSTRA
jgi:hypothetical protein